MSLSEMVTLSSVNLALDTLKVRDSKAIANRDSRKQQCSGSKKQTTENSGVFLQISKAPVLGILNLVVIGWVQ